VFAQLAARRPATLEERRALLAAWRAFVARHGETPEADAGRVEAVAAAVELALASGREDDRADARKEGAAYLARADAGQRGRVRELLARLP
jgi:hypothetical protein